MHCHLALSHARDNSHRTYRPHATLLSAAGVSFPPDVVVVAGAKAIPVVAVEAHPQEKEDERHRGYSDETGECDHGKLVFTNWTLAPVLPPGTRH